MIARKGILSSLRSIVGNNHHATRIKEVLIFCIEDGLLMDFKDENLESYQHNDHSNKRAFIFTPKSTWEFDQQGELFHFTVGALVWRYKDNKREYCFLRRKTYPVGYYTIPAGHLEFNENPQQAIQREVKEETNLHIISTNFLFEIMLEDKCRRGADYHYWYIYSCECSGELTINNESDSAEWVDEDNISDSNRFTDATSSLLKIFIDKYL
jgi:ADP-ribose pyrophosphatase YjhB (NUDIX family)